VNVRPEVHRVISADNLAPWVAACLLAAGMEPAGADLIAHHLVQTSLWGIDSHGVARLPHYLRRIQAGSINPKPQIKFHRTGPCTGQLDGGHGDGIAICHRAMEEAMAMAR
jgi:ureidoglycolate dehydrogenase (NAD+)